MRNEATDAENRAVEFVVLAVIALAVWLVRRFRRPPVPPVGHAYVSQGALIRFRRMEKRRKD